MAGYPEAARVGASPSRVIAAATFRVLRWSIALPLVGLVTLNVMLPFLIFWTALDPWGMIKLAMEAGFVPSLITVAFHFGLARHFPRFWMIPITISISILTAWLWWGLAYGPESMLRDPDSLVLAIAALASLPLAFRRSHFARKSI